MPTSYTSLLGFALPVTGELSGTWGDTVNDYITKYVDAAVAGAQTISGSQTAVTLSVTNGTALSQAGSGATGSAQYQIINCTGNPASALTVTVPSSSRTYLVLNNTSTNQTVTVKGAATTGITVAAARAALIAWNGTDFELVGTDDASKLSGVLAAANGGTGQSSYTTGDILYASGSTTLAKLADVATGNALISGGVGVAPSYGKIGLTTHVSGTLPVANGGTNLTSYTTGDILYASASGTLASLADVATGNALISGGVGVAPSYGKIGLTTHVSGTLPVANGGTGLTSGTSGGVLAFTATGTIASSGVLTANALVIGGGAGVAPSTTTTGTGVLTAVGNAVNTTGGLVTQSGTLTANNILLGGGASTAISSSNLLAVAAAVTTGNYIRAIGYADTVTALGNTGTSINLDVTSGGVFTATLTGNATITLRYPVATGSSSFTLILTNDGTAGRTVAWAGGSFLFPGGAASLSRTTTANAVDVWVFFTPNGGTTWYGNIAMKNMTA